MLTAAEISAHLRASRANWLPRVFPAGRIRAGMFLLGNADGDPGESLSIPLSGRAKCVADFGGNFRGDDLDLYAQGTGQPLANAIKAAGAMLGQDIPPKPINVTKKFSLQILEPFPTGIAIPDHPQLGKPDGVWLYRRPDGRTQLAHLRFDARDSTGKLKKQFRPVIWRDGRFRWEWPATRQLYGLPELDERPNALVLIVEGEKTADAARLMLPGMVVLTWPQGTSGAVKADWTPLKGRQVVVWPDADEPGVKAAGIVAELVRKAEASSVRMVKLPDSLPKGWDLADPLHIGWSVDTIASMISEAPAVAEPVIDHGPLGDEPPAWENYDSHSSAEPPQRDADVKTTKGSGRLKLVRFNDIKAVIGSNTIIKNLLGEGQASCVYGESNCGKSFVVLDIALHIASGRSWRGRRVKQGGVIYVAAEGGFGISNRIAAFKQVNPHLADIPFAIVPCAVNLCNPDTDTVSLINLIKSEAESLSLPIVLVVIDTLSRAMAGANENSPDGMGAYVMNTDRIRQETGAHCLSVHHSGKDAARGARGHSLLRAALDTEVEITRDPVTKIGVARIVKQRDLPTDGEFAFTLTVVELGEDEDGDAITSCVVEEVDEAPVKTKAMSAGHKLAMNKLYDAVITEGIHASHRDIPPNVTVVTVNNWKNLLYQAGIVERGGAGRQKFKRLKDNLLEARHIAICDTGTATFVWPVKANHSVTGVT
ncbi:MAG: AAA family ATPase [Rhodospirillaceae bacterium]